MSCCQFRSRAEEGGAGPEHPPAVIPSTAPTAMAASPSRSLPAVRHPDDARCNRPTTTVLDPWLGGRKRSWCRFVLFYKPPRGRRLRRASRPRGQRDAPPDINDMSGAASRLALHELGYPSDSDTGRSSLYLAIA